MQQKMNIQILILTFLELGINFSTTNPEFYNSTIVITIKDSNEKSWFFSDGLNQDGLGGTGYNSITSNGIPLLNSELNVPLDITIKLIKSQNSGNNEITYNFTADHSSYEPSDPSNFVLYRTPTNEEPEDPLNVSVSDEGWNLYKDILSDQFAPSQWSGIFGSSLSDNINRLINAQNLELSDRWASAEINPLDYLSSQLSVFNDTQSLQDDLSSRFGSIVESNTDLVINQNGFVLTDLN